MEAIRNEQRNRSTAVAEASISASSKAKGDFLSDGSIYDQELYSTSNATSSIYVRELIDEEDEEDSVPISGRRALGLAKSIFAEHARDAEESKGRDGRDDDRELMDQYREQGGIQNTRIADRENDYKRRHRDRALSPSRVNALTGDDSRSYADILRENELSREKAELIAALKKQEAERAIHETQRSLVESNSSSTSSSTVTADVVPKKRRRWDEVTTAPISTDTSAASNSDVTPLFSRDLSSSTGAPISSHNRSSRWDETPVLRSGGALQDDDDGGATPQVSSGSTWDTPLLSRSFGDATSQLNGVVVNQKKRSRWDETPLVSSGGLTSSTSSSSSTSNEVGATPMLSSVLGGSMTSSSLVLQQQNRYDSEIEERNRPITDSELDAILPKKGFKIVDPPTSYVPIRTPSRKLLATPTPSLQSGFTMAPTPDRSAYGIPELPGEQRGGSDSSSALPFIKPDEMQFFGHLLDKGIDEESLTPEERKERSIAQLLLKIKNGEPRVRKVSLKQIQERAREYGAGPLFNQILPLFMSPSLEDQERHLLVKVIDRVLFRLNDLVRPVAHKILVVIEPMLIDDDHFARIEALEVISNLSKAAGLATMIAVMRPDIDSADEYVRNITSRAFAVVASALGIASILPFLKAVCLSKKTWQARHTGVKIIQQIATLTGVGILPHLQSLVDISAPGLVDDNQKVKIMSALAISSLAESAHPYGEESFDVVLKPLWKGIHQHRGKALAAFLKAVGFIIPIMKPTFANYYTREIMPIIIREFASPDDEMKKIVLKVVKQVCGHDGITAAYIRDEVLPEFFRNFWVRRMALDKRNYRAVVETTSELAVRVGTSEIVKRIVADLKDESQPYQRMVIECIDKVLTALGSSDIDVRLEEQLIDGMLFAFQEQNGEVPAEAKVVLNGFSTVICSLGTRSKPFFPQIAGTIKWRLNNKTPTVRTLAAELVSKIAHVFKASGEDALLGHLGVCLYECLGEEYPEVLGAILSGLRGVVDVIGMEQMQPPVKDLLPRLTPILKNRNDKVQEHAIELVGRIADRGATYVSAREWMRICFELLEMLKAPRKNIRKASVNTFGYIAKAIGPQDVLHTLLNNLKVQERQNRVCTTVAIAIVAESCGPFTVLPALMNEYRTPELNVQNGVLKALSFMFEYIGDMARDYIHAITPMLEDGLMDKDIVHRQTACTTVKHLALGVKGLGCEDALQHLLNYVWPNIFETSPHVIAAVLDAVEALRASIGPQRLLAYLLQGLFHPARRVREQYWRIYNNVYVYSADAITPVYPRILSETSIGDEGDLEKSENFFNPYERTYLDLFI